MADAASLHPCGRVGCTAQAAGVVSLQIYPPKALLVFHRTDRPLTQLVIGLELCQQHADEIDPTTMLDSQTAAGIVRMLERHSGVAVDWQSTKVKLLPFDDPDAKVLRAGAAAKPEGTPP